jgi:hypothetical protein
MKWITASDLTTWSDRTDARTDLPELIGDLIRATADNIAAFRFPSGDAGNIRGFDGQLEFFSLNMRICGPISRLYAKTKRNRTLRRSQKCWKLEEGEAIKIARKLRDIGFFEERSSSGEMTFWVPFVCRPYLAMSQGKVDEITSPELQLKPPV